MASFHRVLTASIYGFVLVFFIFIANGANAFPDRQAAVDACWAFVGGTDSSPSAACTVGSQYSPAGYIHIATGQCPDAYANSYGNENAMEYRAFSFTSKVCEAHWASGIATITVAFSLKYFSYATQDMEQACSDEEFGLGANAIWNPSTSMCYSEGNSPEPECEAGDYGDCAVECPQTEYAPAGFTGHGSTCGAVGGSNASFSDTPPVEFGCVGSGSLSVCGSGLDNGQTGSGSGGSHNIDDTFYEYCKNNMGDSECQMTFGETPIPTCQNGAAFDPVSGCDYETDDTVICPDGSQINSNGACVGKVNSIVPIVASGQYSGGSIVGGGGGDNGDNDGDGDIDSDGIIDAVKDVEQSVDEGNATLQSILDDMIDDEASGGGTCTTAPSCSGDAIGCAQVQQTWLLRCDTPESDFSALCGSPFVCSGDSFECARDEYYFDLACSNPLTQGQALTDEAISGTGAALGNMANTLGMDLETMGENKARREAEGYQAFESVDIGSIVEDADFGTPVSGSCPADISFTILNGQEHVIPISDYCDFLFYIGILIRLSGSFVGLRIIFTGLMKV